MRSTPEQFGPLYMESHRETAEDLTAAGYWRSSLLDLLEAEVQRHLEPGDVQAREKQMLVTVPYHAVGLGAPVH